MTFAQYRATPYVPLEILTKLDRAGLGDVPQERITEEQFRAAMEGAVDRPRKVVVRRTCSDLAIARRLAAIVRREAYLSGVEVTDRRKFRMAAMPPRDSHGRFLTDVPDRRSRA